MNANNEQSRLATRQALRECLETVDFAAFELVMKQLLDSCGYVSVYIAGRGHKRGRTAKGGLDLTAHTVTELASALTIVQIKQYKRVVSRRFIDELRGAMLRHGAEQGLLITMSRFSRVAHKASKETDVAPIRLIEGEEVLDLLFTHSIGVIEKNGTWQLDAETIDKWEKRSMGTYRRSMAKPNKHLCGPAVGSQTAAPVDSNQSIKFLPHENSAANSYGGEMTWSTHLMAGLSALWLFELVPGTAPANIAIIAAGAALGSLLPDLDASESKIKHLSISGVKPFLLPSQIVYNQVGHRSFLHSLIGLTYVAICCAALSALTGREGAIALLVGYASHLLTDAATKSGIPLLYPRTKRFHLLPKALRLTTGSQAEEVIFVILSLCAMTFFLHHLGM